MLDLNKIYNMDCLEGMKDIPDKSIDMILCDLPYGTTQNKWDSIIPLDKLWMEYGRIIKDNGMICLTSSKPFTNQLINSKPKQFKYYDLVWDKVSTTGFLNAKRQPLRRHEQIICFYKKQTTYNPIMEIRGKPRNKGSYNKKQGNGDMCYGKFENIESFNNEYYPTSVIQISNAVQKGKVHPTQKPVELLEYLIKTYTNKGETVLDNCMGSGSTAIACINTNRNYIGFEISKEYYDIANIRINNHKATPESPIPARAEMYRKSIRTKRLEAKRKRCAAMRAAKERKRMEFGATMLDVGGITTDGILGEHSIRILSYGDGGRHYAITVDGEHRQARTERGILRCMARMLFVKIGS